MILHYPWALFLLWKLSSLSTEFFQKHIFKQPLKYTVPQYNNSKSFLCLVCQTQHLDQGVMLHPQRGKRLALQDNTLLPENSKLMSWTFRFQERNFLHYLKHTLFFPLKYLPIFSPMIEEAAKEIRWALPHSRLTELAGSRLKNLQKFTGIVNLTYKGTGELQDQNIC